ncbi:hypothetical protein, partial [Anaerovibrio slackiae]|uniref:hypothetical protein n=1 Tax=Anaerovibrio slackiae TaxID=2652309 RepID=UPI0038698F4E
VFTELTSINTRKTLKYCRNMKFYSMPIQTSSILRIFFIAATACILQRIDKKVKSKTKKYANSIKFAKKVFKNS